MRTLDYKKVNTGSGSSGLKAVLLVEIQALKNNKQIIYSSLLQPMLYFFFFAIGLDSTFGKIFFKGTEVDFATYSVIGIIGIMMYTQLNQAVYRTVLDRKWGLLTLKFLSGVNPIQYILGKSFFPLVSMCIQTTVLLISSYVSGVTFNFNEIIGLSVLVFICTLFWSILGIVISLGINSYKRRDFVLQVALVPITFAAPTFFSLENAPFILKAIALLNPLTYQITAMREMIFNGNIYSFTMVVTICLTILILFIGWYISKHIKLYSDDH